MRALLLKKQLQQAFRDIDVDNSGALDYAEMREIFQNLGLEPQLTLQGMTAIFAPQVRHSCVLP